MLSAAGEDLAIEDITSIAKALELLADQEIVRNATAGALRSFIDGIETKLSDVSSSQELDTLSEELVSAAKTYGIRIDTALTRDIQSRREVLEERENEEDSDPYQHAGSQDVIGEITDAEIKSMFALMPDDLRVVNNQTSQK